MKKLGSFITILATVTFLPSQASAGVYSDELAKCVVEKTTEQDKINLIKWMFTAVTLHPTIKALASITEEERNQNNITVARMFERLLISSCKTETVKAVKYEGLLALEAAFQVLGQVAARELFAHPSVSAGMAELDKHFDKKKLEEAFGSGE